MQDKVDPDYIENDFVKTLWEPYQQKIEYQYQADSSEISDSESDNEDKRQEEEQPFETPGSIAYQKLLEHIALQESMKRSDIIISSTLSLSLIPKDKREIKKVHLAMMNQDEISEYIDERYAFNSMLKEH